MADSTPTPIPRFMFRRRAGGLAPQVAGGILVASCCCLLVAAERSPASGAGLHGGCAGSADEPLLVHIRSTLDGSDQPCIVLLSDRFDERAEPVPLLVTLHSWSGDYRQRNEPLEAAALRLGWIVLSPDFRGPNDRPEACGSELAQQDILDAVNWCCDAYPIDRTRIYLTGVSGGGHMTLLMVGRHPQVWAAASAWVGISDLAEWHRFHAQPRTGYAEMMEACCGGPPGSSPEVDAEYLRRSPLEGLAAAVDVPLDLAAGIDDGHTGSVPVGHTLRAFNCLAAANGTELISDEEIARVSLRDGRLNRPLPSDQEVDEVWGREIFLRRVSHRCRVTLFDGGHEGLAEAAIEFLGQHQKASP